ncbi:MAG TPA: DUF1992 domain-containing protein [Actinospica sp.]|jgi:hypothetical protein|nr:DUF1992 domain-containing protein [Actinospica sp.]
MGENADWASRFESLLDRQIRAAQERGEFDDLPGAGKPLASDSAPYRADWWINQVVQRENAGAYAIPPVLALRKIADELAGGAKDFGNERDVRAAVADYNEQAVRVRRLPQEGRAVILPKLDADDVVRKWRELRSAGH